MATCNMQNSQPNDDDDHQEQDVEMDSLESSVLNHKRSKRLSTSVSNTTTNNNNNKRNKMDVDQEQQPFTSSIEPSMKDQDKQKYRLHHFFNYEPDNLLAVHSIAVNEPHSKLAVLRKSHITKSNSNQFPVSLIEIWNFEFDCPFVEQIIHEDPSNPCFTEELVWTRDGNHLLSIGLNEKLNEYDLKRGCIRNSHQITSGPAYCMKLSQDGRSLVVGTDHGFVCIFSLYVGNSFEISYERSFRTDSKIFCLDWFENARQSTIVAGTLNQIKLFNFRTGQCTDIIQIPQKNVNVWTLSIWSDIGDEEEFVIASGLSNGSVVFWDGHFCTQLVGFALHTGDVTSVCTRSGGRAYSVGVDGKLCRFRYVDGKIVLQGRWIHVSKFDLKKICSSERFDCLFFGGSDTELKRTDPSVHLVRSYHNNLHKHIHIVDNMVMYQLKNHLEIYRLPSSHHEEGRGQEEEEEESSSKFPTYLGNVKAKGSIVASAVSQNYVAYAANHRLSVLGWNASGSLEKVKLKEQPKEPVHKLILMEPLLYIQTTSSVLCYNLDSQNQVLINDADKSISCSSAQLVSRHTFKHRIYDTSVSTKYVAVVLDSKEVHFLPFGSQNQQQSPVKLDYLPLFCQWKSGNDFWFCLPTKAYGVYSARKGKFKENGQLELMRNEKANQKITIDGVAFVGNDNWLFYNRNKLWSVKQDDGQVNTFNQYKNIVKVASVNQGQELCVIELPFETMIKNLPPVVYRRRYRLN